MDTEALKSELVRDEGEVLHAYTDSLGYQTIGVGRLIDARRGGGISHDESMLLLGNDIERLRAGLDQRVHCWPELDGVRQRALANMAFQLGIGGVMQFQNMWRAIEARDWHAARDACLDSRYARQTPRRAQRIAALLRDGPDHE